MDHNPEGVEMDLGQLERVELEQECARLRASRDSLQAVVDDLRQQLTDDIVDVRDEQATGDRIAAAG